MRAGAAFGAEGREVEAREGRSRLDDPAGYARLLGLRSSRAKLARAREHLVTLEERIGLQLQDHIPCDVEFGRIDEKSGWVSVCLVLSDLGESHVGIYVGDVVHNLRSALDYIAVYLANMSGSRTSRQQFPIYDNKAKYEELFGLAKRRNQRNGFLEGVNQEVALEQLEMLQPYNAAGGVKNSLLWYVQQLSNADKHREIAFDMGLPTKFDLALEFDCPSPPVDIVDVPLPSGVIDTGVAYEFKRLRFARPYPTYVRCRKPKFEVQVMFGVMPPGKDEGILVPSDVLAACCDEVSRVIDLFESLPL